MKNQAQLIAYVDRCSGGAFRDLQRLLDGPLRDAFGGVHVLPFFHPIDGADAGFDPIDHTEVDPRLGSWDDVRALASRTEIMADMIVNHISRRSPQFADFDARGDASPYAGLFLTFARVFPRGASDADLLALHAIRPGLPFTQHQTAHGERVLLWTTFTSEQIDIDVHHPEGRRYLDAILARFEDAGIRAIRVDAAGFAVKKAGTSCFMIPETLAFIEDLTARARARGLEVLVEVHGHYLDQARIARQVDWVYDFVLPPLVLHTLYTRDATSLRKMDRHQAGQLRHRARHARRHRRAGRRPGGDYGMNGPACSRSRRSARSSRRSTSAAAARASRPPAAPRAISTPIRSTARSTTRSAAETTSTSSRGPFSASCRASRRSTTSGCWPAATT